MHYLTACTFFLRLGFLRRNMNRVYGTIGKEDCSQILLSYVEWQVPHDETVGATGYYRILCCCTCLGIFCFGGLCEAIETLFESHRKKSTLKDVSVQLCDGFLCGFRTVKQHVGFFKKQISSFEYIAQRMARYLTGTGVFGIIDFCWPFYLFSSLVLAHLLPQSFRVNTGRQARDNNRSNSERIFGIPWLRYFRGFRGFELWFRFVLL
jgi:hypothetical protein